MGFLRTCVLVCTGLAFVHARWVPRASVDCNSLPGLVLGTGYSITAAENFAAGNLNGSVLLNEVDLCRVQGTLTYGPGDVPLDNGTNTLTWEIYLPVSSDYNGRFIVVGKYTPFQLLHSVHI